MRSRCSSGMHRASRAHVHIRFDLGTLLFRDIPEGLDLGAIDGIRFDQRVGAWRARACDKDRIVHTLQAKGLEIADDSWRALPAPEIVPPIELRPYQEDAVLAWERARRRGVVVLPTGSGKTRIAIAAIARTGLRTMVLVPTRVLLEQWVAELRKFGFENVGRYGDSHHELGPVTVATIEAAWRAMPRIGDAFDLLVVDEVHRITGEVKSELMDMSIASSRLGLTATMPRDDDAEGLGRIMRAVGPVVHKSTIDELAGTFLSPFEIMVLSVELNPTEREVYEKHMTVWRAWREEAEFIAASANSHDLFKRARKTPEGRRAVEQFRLAQKVLHFPAEKQALTTQLLKEHYPHQRKVLVFTPDNKTAYAIAREHLVPAITCDMARPERAHTLEMFRRGDIRTLVSSQVLNEGVDVPDADVAIVVGGRLGEREHIQRIGRVLRPVMGKSAIAYELVVAQTNEERIGHRRRASMEKALSRPVRLGGAGTPNDEATR